VLLVADYRNLFDLSEKLLKEWAILDTFDALSPTYENNQRLEVVREWFETAEMVDVEVHYGYNGIEGRGRQPR
jgi:hypothetical protein